MILLRANVELQQTFEKLIHATKVPVKWNGIFAVVDNYIILQGEVRSLFFDFDSRKVATNIIEIPEQTRIQPVEHNLRVQNAVNMILYAFGKWGMIKGIRVEKDFVQLNQLFAGIMKEYDVEPEYTPEYMRFYRNGIRITYEDVIQMALEFRDEDEQEEKTRNGGLWRKIIWKKARMKFTCVETTVEERRRGRLGNNFYMVGYLCPMCHKNLHMVVYPEGKEFRIETEEGGVLLARAATCARCQCFFTPRPRKLFAENDMYVMEFGKDTVAYEDYLELLGHDGDRVSNSHCNEFADGRDRLQEEQEESLEELSSHLPELSSREIHKIKSRMEESFYPDESIRQYENAVNEHTRRFATSQNKSNSESSDEKQYENTTKHGNKPGIPGRKMSEQRDANEPDHQENRERRENKSDGSRTKIIDSHEHIGKGSKKHEKVIKDVIITPEEHDEVCKKYDARIEILDRYSERQLKELKRQLQHEPKLLESEREEYLERVERRIAQEQEKQLSKKVKACNGKNYVVIKRTLEEVIHAKIPDESKQPLLDILYDLKREQANREVSQLVEKMPSNMDLNQYRKYVQRIRDYEDVDLAPFEGILKERRQDAEKQEIANMVKRARKVSREDLMELCDRLQRGDFLPELVAPYIEKIIERVRELDAEEIARLCPNFNEMTFAEGMEAYRQIEEGDFLPELKRDALKQLTKRLTKIKIDECELLVQMLKDELKKAGISDNKRHHFYPARDALLKQAKPEELDVIEFAMASYAAGKGAFEYPILVVDTSHGETGKEGIILTPDHLYYSTLMTAYGVSIDTISKIEGSTGILNKGLFMYQKNGAKTKLPYAVESKKLDAFGGVLNSFIHYLQEKPDSRSLTYLASERHENICCFRCGYEYKGDSVCPKCGYQNNE